MTKNKQLPFISIVTPSFNQSTFIVDALESVHLQNYPSLEHLIVDGSSTDGTVELLQTLDLTKKYPYMEWYSEPDNGQSEALNKGFRQARGDIIGWLNSDDRYRNGCFAKIAQAFEDHPEVDIIYGDYAIIDINGETLQFRHEIEFSNFVLMYHRVLYIATTATFFRKKVFDEGNYLSESLHYAMDVDFFVRLASRGYRFKHLAEVVSDYRLQPNSKTCSAPFMQKMEHEQVIFNVAPVLQKFKSLLFRKKMLSLLRLVAAAKRYTEKLLSGCYWR